MRADTVPLTALPPLERPWRQACLLLWRDKFALVSALYLALMVLCALSGPGLLEDVATKMDLRGRNAPPFTLETPTGRKVSLDDYRGRTVLLEFFATWCPHCAAQTPYLRELAKSMDPSKYAFLSINADGEDAASVFAYELYFGLPFPALLDPSSDPGSFSSPGSAGPVSAAYEVGYFPTFYVIDPNGRITWRSDGEQPTALLRQELRRAAGA